MEIQEIEEALRDFQALARRAREHPLPPAAVQDHMLVFLQRVLGYDFKEDIVLRRLSPPGKRPAQVDFNRKVKFLAVNLGSRTRPGEKQIQQAVDYALGVPTNVVMLSNAIKLGFYSVDCWEGRWEVEPLLEVDLLRDAPAEVAALLWPLAKKDCGRKIWVKINDHRQRQP